MTNIACCLTSQERLQYSGRPYANLYTRGNDAVIYPCRNSMVTHIEKLWINRVRLPTLLGSAEQGKFLFPCPRSCLRIWSRETRLAVLSRVSLVISILRLNLVLTYGIPPEFRGGVRLFI